MIEKYTRKLLLPAFYKAKKYNRLKYFFELNKRDSKSYEELKELQWKKLKGLIHHCYNNIPYYKSLFLSYGLHPDCFKDEGDIKNIPILTRDLIRSNYENLFDPSISRSKFWYDRTSGSTGHALRYARIEDEKEYGFAMRYRSNSWVDWNYYDRSVWIVTDSRRITQINSLKGRASLLFAGRLQLDTKNVTRDEMFRWVASIRDFAPSVVYGYSSILAEFSEFLLQNNIKINSVKTVISTAEPLKKRKVIGEAFNANVFDQYGASEIPCIGHECKCGSMHINFDELFIEFEDMAPGSDMKKIIITPLFIKSFPLLRYEIGDTAIPAMKECNCGLPYPVIELKAGRISDNLITRDGRIISGVTVGWYVNDIVKDIEQFQIIQNDYEEITVIAVIKDKISNKDDEDAVIQYFKDIFKNENLIVNIKYTERIIPEKNGKIRTVISKVMENHKINSSDSEEMLLR